MKDIYCALVQQACGKQKIENMEKSAMGISEAAKEGADLVVLQELHNTQYFCQSEDEDNFDLSESIPGPSTQYFSKIAKEHGVVLVISVFEKRASGLYHNTAVVIEKDGSIAGTYRKMHIPDDPGYYEKFYFAPGDSSYHPIHTSLGKLGVLICWDQWYPEAARMMCLSGADLLLYPSAIGWSGSDSKEEKENQLDAWKTIQRAHAIANGVPVISVNRTGYEASPNSKGGIHFWGNSFICGPQGDVLGELDDENEAVLLASINLSQNEKVRRQWPFLRDRRIDSYQEILERFRDSA